MSFPPAVVNVPKVQPRNIAAIPRSAAANHQRAIAGRRDHVVTEGAEPVRLDVATVHSLAVAPDVRRRVAVRGHHERAGRAAAEAYRKHTEEQSALHGGAILPR